MVNTRRIFKQKIFLSEEMRELKFEDGAKWADEHPNLYNDEKYHTVKMSDLDSLYKRLELYEKYLENSCEWIDMNIIDYIVEGSREGISIEGKKQLINDFRKAMEDKIRPLRN